MKNIQIDDVLSKMHKAQRKTRINSQRKGNGWEKELCRLLAKRFQKPFNRSPGSGAVGTTAKLDNRALDVLTADIITPEGFKWSIEAKKGYEVSGQLFL